MMVHEILYFLNGKAISGHVYRSRKVAVNSLRTALLDEVWKRTGFREWSNGLGWRIKLLSSPCL